MKNVREMRNEALGKRVAEALKSRNMDAWYVKTKEEAVRKALELIPEGSTINMGGSASVRESGLTDAISSGNYVFYDRDKASTPEEKQEIALKAFQRKCHERGRSFCEYRRKREPCGCICVRSGKCSPYCRNEQGGQNRGGRHAQSQKRGGTDQYAALWDQYSVCKERKLF